MAQCPKKLQTAYDERRENHRDSEMSVSHTRDTNVMFLKIPPRAFYSVAATVHRNTSPLVMTLDGILDERTAQHHQEGIICHTQTCLAKYHLHYTSVSKLLFHSGNIQIIGQVWNDLSYLE